MGIFESDFDIENYIRKRIPELDNLYERDLFKAIISSSTVELYKHIKEEYDALEKRIFDEAPRALRMPDLITCVVDSEKYDYTDAHMFPMFHEDLAKVRVNAADMISAVANNQEFYLYTCMIQADYLELRKLIQTQRRFKGVIQNEYGETPAEFILKQNERYIKKAEEIYEVAKLNYLPWRSVNTAYLYKLFDVYVVSIEQWDEQLEVLKVTTEFDEFSEKVFYNPLPIWNAFEVTIKANSYPQPAVDRKYYEHYLYKKQFIEGHDYLLRRADTVIRNIRRQDGDIYIMCDSNLPKDWEFYEFVPSPDPRNYANPLMSNEQNESFSRNMTEYFGQRIKTRTELIRFFNSFKCSKWLTFVDAKIKGKPRKIETYSTEKFIDYEYRTGDRAQTLEFTFRPQDEDFYLNRDIMSFLVTEIQHLFPEYQCVGKLV
ncbi:MAG: hypothetical protein IKZ58_05250 [Selenomonadaceae bacterium]|nr:hypothetical protein [Selenomonadaceae bacterium]